MGGTGITDGGLVYLNGLRKLNTMDLRGTKVTDDGLELLAQKHALKSLVLGEGQATSNTSLVLCHFWYEG